MEDEVFMLEELNVALWYCWGWFLVFLGLFLLLIKLFLCLLFLIEKLIPPEVVGLEGSLTGWNILKGLLAALVQM